MTVIHMLCQNSVKTALDGFKSGVRSVASTTVIQAVLADEVGIYIHAVKLGLTYMLRLNYFLREPMKKKKSCQQSIFLRCAK